MEKYSKLQLSHLKKLNTQIEACLTRTKILALTNAWRQKQPMRNHQSKYDGKITELSNSALHFKTQEHITNRKFEFENMGVGIHNSIS